MLSNLFLLFLCVFETHAFRHYELDELTDVDEENDMVELPLTYTQKANRDPVVLIPGLAGSQLESRQTNETKWERMWVKVRRVVSDFDQFKKDFVPIYDPVTNTYSNRDGLIVRPRNYGGVKGIAYMDDTLSWFTGTYQPLIKALQEVGYKVKKDLWGVPWDFRLDTADQLATNGEFAKLKWLLEESYRINQKPAVVLTHSCGCPLFHIFLTTFVTPEWKSKHVKGFIPCNGPFGGSMEAFQHLSTVHSWVVPFTGKVFNQITQSLACLYWMLPNENAYGKDGLLAEFNKTGTQIRMSNMNDTWTTTGRSWMSIAAYHSLKVMNKPQEHPGVPTHVFFSHGKKTTTSIVIKEEKEKWWKEEAEGVIGDGDGTVPLASLLVPLKWKNENNHPLEFHEFEDISHGQILKDKKSVAKIISIVAQN
ncbi:putative Phosphatidylcholine-sterol acyltransferase [Blattamonas nauphoetae]|uniref:Phosphatidylcholine-sterol acyltransferase n=1 Tax=Blattamonas nauphoetae TaxID=2049346 RepID=A0ABQ9Y7I0_9EUKA|nr:putative Phosphatidylcholine-sterol acyltransferase [Blattamonas nauphoetae]